MDVDVVDKNAATGGGDGSVEGKSLARGEFLDDIPDALTQTELIQRRREKISQLLDLYKEQYWVLADDLYERARSFRESNRDGEDEAPTTSASAAPSETLEKHYEARVDGDAVGSTRRLGTTPDAPRPTDSSCNIYYPRAPAL